MSDEESVEGVELSQFYMWRTLFAVAHADHVVTDEEIEFMAQILEDIKFSEEQTAILKDDIVNAKNVEDMFDGIEKEEDRLQFFEFARDLVWVDGDFGSEEQGIMIKLHQHHCQSINLDDLVGRVSLELEEDEREKIDPEDLDVEKGGSLSDMLKSFRLNFLSKNS
ncbi:MAG: DUF533 domain-containing protein [Alphaproteobacteria bacterium]